MHKIIKHPIFYLTVAIIVYIAVFCYLSFYKYANFLYNLEDLAIFTNVLHNTTQGKWFWFSTHGGYSYLADHLELTLLLITPFFRLFPTALTLLFFQTLLFGLSAWPFYLIAKNFFSKSPNLSGNLKKYAPLLIALIFLANPYLQNINLEEFHTSPFLAFFFLWTFYFYLQKKYKLFLLFFILTLISREDASLTLGAFSILIAWENRNKLILEKKWWLYPMIFSAFWFVLAMSLIKFLNPEDGYKYLLLYGTVLTPLSWLLKIFSSKIFFLLLGLLLPFLFIPVLKPKYLFLAVPTFLQIALLNSSGISVVFFTHYQTFFLIPLFLALIETISTYKFKPKNIYLILIILLGTQFFISIYLGPLNFLTNKQNYLKNLEDKNFNKKILSLIPAEASVSGPYRLLPHLSNRQTALVNKLTFLGKKHLSAQDFILPKSTEYLLLDATDMLEYYLHFTNRQNLSSLYWQGAERVRKTIKQLQMFPVAQSDSLILYAKENKNLKEPYAVLELQDPLPINFILQKQNLGPVEFLGYNLDEQNLIINLFFQTNNILTDDYFFRFSSADNKNTNNLDKIYPPAYGLFPTHDWPIEKIIRISQPLPFLSDFVNLKLLKIKGDIELGPLNDTRLIIDEEKILGQVELKIIFPF